VPEFKLREASDKGAELLVLLCRKSTCSAIFHIIVCSFIAGIKFGLEKSKEEVE